MALRHELLAAAPGPDAGAGAVTTIDAPAWEVYSEGDVEVTLTGPAGERPVWRTGAPAAGVRVLVDGSILEAFEDGTATTVRACPAADERWTVRATHPMTAWALRP